MGWAQLASIAASIALPARLRMRIQPHRMHEWGAGRLGTLWLRSPRRWPRPLLLRCRPVWLPERTRLRVLRQPGRVPFVLVSGGAASLPQFHAQNARLTQLATLADRVCTQVTPPPAPPPLAPNACECSSLATGCQSGGTDVQERCGWCDAPTMHMHTPACSQVLTCRWTRPGRPAVVCISQGCPIRRVTSRGAPLVPQRRHRAGAMARPIDRANFSRLHRCRRRCQRLARPHSMGIPTPSSSVRCRLAAWTFP